MIISLSKYYICEKVNEMHVIKLRQCKNNKVCHTVQLWTQSRLDCRVTMKTSTVIALLPSVYEEVGEGKKLSE